MSKILNIYDICSSADAFLAATVVTDGELLRGLRSDSYEERLKGLVIATEVAPCA